MTTRVTAEPLTGPDFGSYKTEDVKWLLKDLSDVSLEAPIEEREEAIQSGGAHYAESLPVEYQPSVEYQELFKSSLKDNAERLAEAVGTVTELTLRKRGRAIVLVSLARAGTPIGVLMRRYAQQVHGLDVPHYAVSIVRGKGIDYNALNYLAANHKSEDIVFVDGWTGKGAIVKELTVAVSKFNEESGTNFNSALVVLADPGHCVKDYGTREDYLIPSACLNSTVSGLVSRTVLNDDLIKENDYHGAKFYKEFADTDYSNYFVDEVEKHFTSIVDVAVARAADLFDNVEEPDFSGWAAVERISEEYGINSVNLVKPGVGETTRVLLRRVPWKILVREGAEANLYHIRMLAANRGVQVDIVENLPYSCVGLIHPQYTKGATGADGKIVK